MMQTEFNIAHRKAIDAYTTELRRLYLETIKAASQYINVAKVNQAGQFFFRSNPEVSKSVDNLLSYMFSNIKTLTIESISSEWDRAVELNNEVVRKVFGTNLDKMPIQYVQKYLSGNEAAKKAFIGRKNNGLGLSNRVWNMQQQFKKELELAMQYGIGKGHSAGQLAQDIQGYLNEPDRLYRRIKQTDGTLRLSKAAKAYNPGRGVYRSSFKNAYRFARNEINFSYQESNQLKYKQQPFTTAMEIRVSPSHNPEDDKGGVSCIDLQGIYPKDFDWTYKWHVNCMCMSLSVQKPQKEIDEDVNRILSGKEPRPASAGSNYVRDVPEQYNRLGRQYIDKSKSPGRTFAKNPIKKDS